MVLGGILALVYPLFSSVAIIVLLGWLLIISGIFQGISLIVCGKGDPTERYHQSIDY